MDHLGNVTELVIAVIFGSIGLGYFVYGRRQRMIVATLSGIGLMVFPYMVSGPTQLLVAGILGALPFFLRV